MDEPRLSPHLEVAGLLRAVSQAGGFAAVLHKGDPDAGTILVVAAKNGTNRRLWERMPDLEHRRKWQVVRTEDIEDKHSFDAYLARRRDQDPEVWIIELDIAEAERFVGLTPL